MTDLTSRVKNLAKRKGATLVGVALAGDLGNAPRGHHPEDFLPQAKSLISIALRMNRSSIIQLPKTMREYKASYDAANLRLNSLAFETASLLENKGYEALAIPASTPYDKENIAGDLSHKHVAVAAGLGMFGISNLVLTPEYGPYVRFVTVVTSAKLEPDKRLTKSICMGEKCLKCVKACPVGALENSKLIPNEGWKIDKRKCHEYIRTVSGSEVCGLCMKVCPVPRRVLY